MRCVALALLLCATSVGFAQQSSISTGNFNLGQVSPAFGRNGGGGISYVTRPTPMATAVSTAQGFFAAGGVNVGGVAAGSAGGGVAVANGPALIAGTAAPRTPAPQVPSDKELARLANAANRGDARAQAQLAIAARAMLARDEAAAASTAPAAVATPAAVTRLQRR